MASPTCRGSAHAVQSGCAIVHDSPAVGSVAVNLLLSDGGSSILALALDSTHHKSSSMLDLVSDINICTRPPIFPCNVVFLKT